MAKQVWENREIQVKKHIGMAITKNEQKILNVGEEAEKSFFIFIFFRKILIVMSV